MKRRGFTLIELLVVIAIIAILIGLLIPAVQKVRETMLRASCTNNMKQIGIALNSYEESNTLFPSACLNSGTYGPSALQRLLPYLEQANVVQNYNDAGASGASAGDANNDAAGAVRIKTYMCPSDPRQGEAYAFGWTNYHSNYGTWIKVNGLDGSIIPTFAAAGSPAPPKTIRATDMTDGHSQTAAFAEVCNGNGGTPAAVRDPRVECFDYISGAGDTTLTGTLVSARTTLLAQNWRTANYAGNAAGWGNGWHWRGYPWREGSVWRSGYNHLLPPNSACWFTNNDWWALVTPASSWHDGGVNVVMCDGSVRFVSDKVNADVWTAAGSRSGNEPQTLP